MKAEGGRQCNYRNFADIARILEKYPELRSKVPQEIRARLVDESTTD